MKYIQNSIIAGDAIYILWILYNGANEGFKNIFSVQAVALLGLVVLLSLNITLLGKK